MTGAGWKWSLVCAALACSGAAGAQPEQDELSLEIWINGYTGHQSVRATPQPDGSIAANCDDLATAGLRVLTGIDSCRLSPEDARIGMSSRQLLVTVRDERLVPSLLSARAPPVALSLTLRNEGMFPGAILLRETGLPAPTAFSRANLTSFIDADPARETSKTVRRLAAADALPPAEQGELLLEVWINGYTRHETARVTPQADGSIAASCEDLAAAGLLVSPSANSCRLSSAEARIDTPNQQLLITVADDRLAPEVLSARGEPSERFETVRTDGSLSGAVLLYDANAQTTELRNLGRRASAGLALDGALFGRFGAITARGFGDAVSGYARFISTETAYVRESSESLLRFVAGDSITGSLPWTRAVRFGGLQLASDFSLQPDLVTQPMPRFFGQSAVPSTLDVFINNARVFQQNVDPGPFEVRDLPAITGPSEVTVVTRDALGRQTSQTLQIYSSNELLRPDLTGFSLDAGFIHEKYGVYSMAYGKFITMGTVRHGVKDWLTLEGHVQFGGGVSLGGMGAVMRLGSLGVASLAVAGGQSHLGTGALGYASFEAAPLSWLTLRGETAAVTQGYRDVATINAALPARLIAQAGASASLGKYGSLTLSWISTTPQKREPPPGLLALPFLGETISFPFSKARSEFINATYSLSFSNNWSVYLTGFHDAINRTQGAELMLSIPMDKGNYGEASARVGEHRPQYQASIARSPDSSGGWGYRFIAEDGPARGGEGYLLWNGQQIGLNSGFSAINGRAAARLGASGGLAAIDGDVMAMRRIDGAFALVDAGQPDVHIMQENRQVAVTGPKGTALIPGLTPYGRNAVSVSPDDYPMDVIISDPERTVIPNRYGAIVKFAPRRSAAALVTLHLPDGSDPPLGAPVRLDDGSEPLVVGAHGEIFITNLAAPVRGHVQLANGTCGFAVTPAPSHADDAIPRLGPVVCQMETNNAPVPQNPR